MIGLYGGTFDPIHFGHLRPVLEVKQSLQLDSVRFIPCHHPAHRLPPSASARQRLHMLQLAIDHQPGFEIDTQELERTDISYTVNTLTAIRVQWAKIPLCLIMGLDAFNSFQNWHHWKTILKLAHLIVMHRPGDHKNSIPQLLRQRLTTERQSLNNTLSGLIFFQSVTQLAISATDIRQLLRENQDPRYLLPDTVLHFIQQQKLYQSTENTHAK